MIHLEVRQTNLPAAGNSRYRTCIGGQFIDPIDGRYYEKLSPGNGPAVCRIPCSRAHDNDIALDAPFDPRATADHSSIREASG